MLMTGIDGAIYNRTRKHASAREFILYVERDTQTGGVTKKLRVLYIINFVILAPSKAIQIAKGMYYFNY